MIEISLGRSKPLLIPLRADLKIGWIRGGVAATPGVRKLNSLETDRGRKI